MLCNYFHDTKFSCLNLFHETQIPDDYISDIKEVKSASKGVNWQQG